MGGSALTVACFLCGVTAIGIRFYLKRQNAKNDAHGGDAHANIHANKSGQVAQKAFRFAL